MTSIRIDDYHIGITCALKIEQAAVRGMLDQEYGIIGEKDVQDHNTYFGGRIHKHHVVIACLPAGVDGIAAAATAAKDMLRTFKQLRFGLLVGIGGGIPDNEQGVDIRLGDVVVSQPQGIHGGVVQHDRGKREAGGKWKPKGMLNAPPKPLLTALQALQTEHELEDSQTPMYLAQMLASRPKMKILGYAYPGAEKDVLYSSPDNTEEDAMVVVPRQARLNNDPQIHYGTIVSGNSVIKDATYRDQLRREYEAMCVEMEAAGLMNEFPCLVIRGICDYADRHKNDGWHRYAAATAAALAKELLLYISGHETTQAQPAQELLGILEQHFRRAEDHNQRVEGHHQQQEDYNLRKETNYQNDKHRECHGNFKTSDYENFKNLNPRPIQNTCQWVLNHETYVEWLRNTNKALLWISADPGCGKSVLSRFLVESYMSGVDDSTITSPEAPVIVCYFFFKDNETQDSVAVAFSAILHQLFSQQPELIHHALPAYEESGGKSLGVDEMWRILHSAASDEKSRAIICVLDALDECRNPDQQRLIDLICDSHINKSTSQNSRIRWLVTSRPYDDIQDGFEQIPSTFQSIRLKGENENDQIRMEINLVVRERMKTLARELRLSSKRAHEVTEQLLAMEHRTHLWLYLAIDSIKTTFCNALRPDDEPILALPTSVEDAYEKILARVIDSTQKKRARDVLMIIVGARRPLTIPEVALALDVHLLPEPNSLSDLKINPVHLEENIRHWCGLFVFITHGRLYLLHQTAKEFLLSRSDQTTISGSGWKHCLQPIEVGRDMARICVLYLCLAEFDSQSRLGDQREDDEYGIEESEHLRQSTESLFDFAAEHWAQYVRSTETLLDNRIQARISMLYNMSSNRSRRWIEAMWRASGYSRHGDIQMREIQLAAFNGHLSFLEGLLANSPGQLDSEDPIGRTALSWAAEMGHLDLARMLVSKGANVNARGGYYNNALCVASKGGHLAMAEFLVSKGANVNAGGRRGAALHLASATDQTSVVELLLSSGADVNAQGKTYPTALYIASGRGHLATVKLLLDKRADVNIQGNNYATALNIAAGRGHLAVTELLLSRGADINARGAGRYGTTALFTASEQGRLAVVDLLLSHEAEVNATVKRSTALYVALENVHLAVVELLLSNGADINAGGGHMFGIALSTASMRGDAAVVELLLSKGIGIDNEESHYSAALRSASKGGHLVVVKLLLSEGADIEAPGSYGTALCTAAAEGHLAVVELLLSKGAIIAAQRRSSSNALYRAAAGGHRAVVELLLSKGVDIEAPGDYGTALYTAAAEGHLAVVELLLSKGADVEAIGRPSSSPLCRAAAGGHLAVVKLLLSKGADIEALGRYGTALYAAAVEGHIAVVELLLSKGADIEAQSGHGTALESALSRRHWNVVKLLLRKGASHSGGLTVDDIVTESEASDSCVSGSGD